jgi:hypothetical protein
MRTLLLSVLILAATSLHAQHFQIGIDGGAVYGSKPAIVGEQFDNNQHRFIAGGIRAMYDCHHWQCGVSIGYRTNSFSGSFHFYGDDFSTLPPPDPKPIKFSVSQKEIPLRLFINRKIAFKRLETYIGPFIGYTFAVDKIVVSVPNEPYPTYHHDWLVGGVQVGATYFVTKRLGINVELSGEYNVRSGSKKDEYAKYSFPATLGIRCKL